MEKDCGTCGWRNKGHFDKICTMESITGSVIKCDYTNNYRHWASEEEVIKIHWENMVPHQEDLRVLKRDW